MKPSLLTIFLAISTALPLSGSDWHVNVKTGSDKNAGNTPDTAFVTIQRAVNLCSAGDTIFLHPKGAVARQMVSISGKGNFTIEGNDVILDASEPLPPDGWDVVKPGLFRRKLPQTAWNRHLLIVDGKMERMNRTQSSNSPPFPDAEDLKPGQFRFENIEGTKQGWLYVRGSTKNLEWAVRRNGVATSGEVENVTVRNLNTRYALNDGFNIHGHTTGLLCVNVTGYECFDEGFSAHDTCECKIVNGKFRGNENGIADVNQAVTVYAGCEFSDNVNTDVLLIGRRHELIDCTIKNTTTAVALVGGPRKEGRKNFTIRLKNVSIAGARKDGKKARVRVNGGTLKINNSKFVNVEFVPTGAKVMAENTILNGGKLKSAP